MASTSSPAPSRPANGDGKRGKGRPSSAVPLDRVLPNSQEAEMAVLGAMLHNPAEAGSLARERLSAEHFYYASHQAIFREIAALQDALQAVDLVTLTQRLRDKNQLEEIGGPAYLSDLVTNMPTVAHVEHYINIVWEKQLLRKLIEAAHEILTESFEPHDDVRDWIDRVEQQMFDISAERSTSGAVPVKDVIKQAMHSIDELCERKGMTGLPTGFRDLDKITSGLHGGTVFVLAARPSMGKTSLAMNIAENIAIDHGHAVGIFSLEMSAEELVKRMLCSRSRVSLSGLSGGFLGKQDHGKLTETATELMKAPIFVDDAAGLTIQQVRARARRLKLQHNIQLLVIDYLQLMRAPSRRADSSRQVEIADISGGVKALAKELKIPIIVLSQLNRQPEQRDGKPKLADLRESGAIEQDADIVGLLVRPEVYADNDEERAEKRGQATLIIAKQRSGPTGDVNMTFRGEYTRFEDAARVDHEDVPIYEGDQE